MTLIVLLFALLVPDEAATTAALDKFKTDYKVKDAAARATAVADLAKTQDDKIYAKLGSLLAIDEKDVRIAAAKGLGGATESKKKCVSYLAAATAPNAKEPTVLAAILEALGKLKEAPALQEIERYLKSRNTPVCEAAIKAAGEIGARTSVPALIDCMKWLEAGAQEANIPSGGKGYGGGGIPGLGGGTNYTDQDAREREKLCRPIVQKVLSTITKASNGTVKEWENWWRDNGARFLSGK